MTHLSHKSISPSRTPRGFGEQLQPHSRAKNGNSHIMHHATIDPINTYRKGIKQPWQHPTISFET